MKIMVLGNSEMHGGRLLAPEQAWPHLIVEPLSAKVGEPVEMFTRTIWPDDNLIPKLKKWLDRENPDIVFIDVNGYWYMYESVPNKMRRWFGPAAKPVAAGGEWAGRTPLVSYNPLARGIRRGLQVTMGGDTLYTTDYIIDSIRQCVRLCLQGEDRVVMVKTPNRGGSYAYGRKGAQRRDARKLAVHNGLYQFCKDLHVEYSGFFGKEPPSGATRQGDNLHSDAEGQLIQVERWMKRLLPLCAKVREGRGLPTAGAEAVGSKL